MIALEQDDSADHVAVERAVSGDRSVRLNRSEKAHAVELMARQGASDNQIALRLAMNFAAVARYRRLRNVPAAKVAAR